MKRGAVGQLLQAWAGEEVVERRLNRPSIDVQWDPRTLRRGSSRAFNPNTYVVSVNTGALMGVRERARLGR